MKNPLRVHICVVGFELDRISLAAIQMKADKVYLITQEKNDKGELFFKENKKRLEENGILVKEEYVTDIRDFYNLLSKIKSIIISENEDNYIYINTTSGSTLASIAGTISSMMFSGERNIIPYYVKPTSYSNGTASKEGLKPLSNGVEEITEILTFPMKLPKRELSIVLEYLKMEEEHGHIVTKKDLIAFSSDNKELKALRENKKTLAEKLNEMNNDGDSNSKKNVARQTAKDYAWLNQNIISKLKDEWESIEIERIGQYSCIKLSKKGKNILKYLTE